MVREEENQNKRRLISAVELSEGGYLSFFLQVQIGMACLTDN